MAFLKRHRLAIALALLAFTAVAGLYGLFSADWRVALRFWSGRGWVLCAVFGLHTVNMMADGFLWLWLLAGFGIRPGFVRGALIYFSGFAGQLVPAQLGRLVRPEELARLGHGRFMEAAKAEGMFIVMMAVSSVALLSALLAGLWRSWAAVPAALAVTVCFLCFAALGLKVVPRLSRYLPDGYFVRPSTVAIACLSGAGWVASGLGLYLILREIVPDVPLWQALAITPSGSLVGAASGMPGGLGAVEGYLGVTFHAMRVPPEHLALAVGALRLITFWIWIPVGWAALAVLGRLPAAGDSSGAAPVNEDER